MLGGAERVRAAQNGAAAGLGVLLERCQASAGTLHPRQLQPERPLGNSSSKAVSMTSVT